MSWPESDSLGVVGIFDLAMSVASEEPVDVELLSYKKLFLEHLSCTQHHFYTKTPEEDVIESKLRSSIVPPNTFWTNEEKEIFFRSISRHSKLRPDLIAADIGEKKTVVDVIAYIALLEEGVKSLANEEIEDDDDDDDVVEEPLQHSARVMSDKWIHFEEIQSVKLMKMEIQWEAENVERERIKLARKIKKTIGSSRAEGLIRSRALDREYRQRFEAEMEVVEKQWAREDMLERLGELDLSNIQKIIRVAEEEEQQQRQGRFASPNPEEDGRPPKSGMAQEEDGMASMTPEERRRWQKRMYMRRMRAAASGTVAVEDERRLKPGRRPNEGHSQTKHPEPTRSTNSTIQGITGANVSQGSKNGIESPRDDEGRRYRPRGLTTDQKIQKSLQDLEVDITFLREHGLDLFNLSKFGWLWSVIGSDSDVDSISYTTLKMMRLLLDLFLHAVIHCVIVNAEEEREMKEQTKVFKDATDSIKSYHVINALNLLGFGRYKSRKWFLERIGSSDNTAASTSDDYAGPGEEGDMDHRDNVYPPIVYHETLLEPLDTLVEGDVIMPVDEEAEKQIQMAELAANYALESIDALNDKRHERMLWKRMGISPDKWAAKADGGIDLLDYQDEDGTVEVHGDASNSKSLRLRPADENTKSQPFIFDSDEEEDQRDDMMDI
ncbi:hypothetical protein FRB91_007110 [Serendipita sp. 411]|nr:hypothetical protein FRB91_007110 [Serendipita sp. 411]